MKKRKWNLLGLADYCFQDIQQMCRNRSQFRSMNQKKKPGKLDCLMKVAFWLKNGQA